MKLFRVLHLSDIHIGDTYMQSRDIAYRIISDIENEKLSNIQCVIVTGDIFEGKYGFDENIIAEAVDFFNIIFEEIKQTTFIEKHDFLFIPGNHDIVRDIDNSIRWKKYSAFLKGFYGDIPDFYDMEDYSLLKTYDDSRIVFAGLNSCGLKEESLIDEKIFKDVKKIEDLQFTNAGFNKQDILNFIDKQTKTKKYVDYGEIPPKQILRLKRELNKCDDYNIIAFFHHHFYLFPEVYSKYGDSSLIRNFTNVIQQLQQAGVKTVLHGHKHFDLERPLITDSYYENINNVINIFAGGSVGTSRVNKHTFNIIDFYDRDNDLKLVQRKFTYNNDQLEPIVVKQIPPKAAESNSSIKLLSVLDLNNPDLLSKYTDAVEKINIVADDYNNIIKWLESVFVGFDEVHKIFENDPMCVFYMLFAMNYRVLKIKQIYGHENIDSSYYDILNKLFFDEIPEADFDKNRFLKLFDQSDLNKLKEKCDDILSTLQNRKSKFYLSFSMVAIFVTDIYLMLRYYAGGFYNKYIKYKVNIKLDETEFHQNVPVQKIMIHSDADRRSAFIDLKCTSATSHKLAVLFVKEFELIISKFEDYFKIVGLKIYYLIPKIEKGEGPNTVDNYNFEAYIPTLIPLLTGDNIYAQKEVFARELIQNSIDAIAVRSAIDNDFNKSIHITLGNNKGRKFFRIKDCGTGMDRFKIERYFTSIGRSFYSGDEYRDLELDYKPISNFGIGFLSAFMICREIDVKTRYYVDEKEGLKLHIPNYDGCFFIEKDDNIDIGTEITLYIDKKISHDISHNDIINYILRTMSDINCEIIINDEISKETHLLESRNIRKIIDNKQILFIPFLESGNIESGIDVKNTIWTGNYIDKYPYGLIINVAGWEEGMASVLNSGIRLNDTSVNDIWSMLLKNELHNNYLANRFFSFNFPSNYLNIDVSREKISEFDNNVLSSNFVNDLLKETHNQILQYIDLCKIYETGNKAINLYGLVMSLFRLSRRDQSLGYLRSAIMSTRYILYLRFNETSIDVLVSRSGNKPENSIAYMQNNYAKCNSLFDEFVSNNATDDEKNTFFSKVGLAHKVIPRFNDFVHRRRIWNARDDEYYYNYISNEEFFLEAKEHLQKMFVSKNDNIVYYFLLLSAFMLNQEGEKNHMYIMDTMLTLLLENSTVSQVENGECGISIPYDELRKIIKRMK